MLKSMLYEANAIPDGLGDDGHALYQNFFKINI